MVLGQVIHMEDNHPNGVGRRVAEKLPVVEEIYGNPEKYKDVELEHHTAVALRELAMEEIRKTAFPQYPSRMACLYASDCLEESEKWAELFQNWGRRVYQIVKLKIHGTCFVGDAENCFAGCENREKNLAMALRYWQNQPNREGLPPIREILVGGDLEVTEIVRTFMK